MSRIEEQRLLATQVMQHDTFELVDINRVGGFAISCSHDDTRAYASIVVMSYPSLDVIVQNTMKVIMTEPYESGFLGFREVDHFLSLLDSVKHTMPQAMPQVVLIEGNGVMHPRRCGSASHLGIAAQIATIGIATTCSKAISDYDQVKAKEDVMNYGDLILLTKDNIEMGVSLRTTRESIKPIYVSVGHNISLSSSLDIAFGCCRSRIPEPLRLASQISREMLRQSVE